MSRQCRTAVAMTAGLLLLAVSGDGSATEADSGHVHMNDNPRVGMLLVDQLEWQKASGDPLVWNVSARLGNDTGRVWFRSEGEMPDGDVESSRSELLWARYFSPWWEVVGGVRQDAGTGPGRTYGLIGVQGLAPYWFHVEADLFAGERGQVGARAEAQYDILLTNRLILQPRAEIQAWGKDDDDTGVGSGLSSAEFGLRLRYEVRREFAPYLGVEWSGAVGDTADLARASDEDVRDVRLVAGLRFWF